MKHEQNNPNFIRVYQTKDTEETYKKFKEAFSNVYPVYENCDGRETVYKDYQQVKIETSDGIIDGYVGTICGYLTITYGMDEQDS